MNLRVLPAAAALTLLLGGCIVYRVDVQQGNEITAAMTARLQLGMSQQEVTRLLGYPLLNDPFHKDRWDYFYSKKSGKTGAVTRQRAALHFKDGRLVKVDSEFPAQEAAE